MNLNSAKSFSLLIHRVCMEVSETVYFGFQIRMRKSCFVCMKAGT